MRNLFSNKHKISKPVMQATLFFTIALIVCIYLASKINAISDEIIEKRATLFLYQNSREQFAVLREDAQNISQHIDVVNNVFPSSENVLPFINVMEDLATKNGMQHAFKFEAAGLQPVENFNLNRIPFSVSLNGTPNQFLGYLAGLEKMPYFTKIDSLGMSSPQVIDGQSQMNIRGFLYVR